MQPQREHVHNLGREYKRWRLTVFQFSPFVFQSVLPLHEGGAARIKSASGRGSHEYVTSQKWPASLKVYHIADTQILTVYSRLTMIKVKIFSCMSIGRLYLGFSSFTSLSLQKSFFTTKDWNLGPQFSIHMSSSCTHKKLLLHRY